MSKSKTKTKTIEKKVPLQQPDGKFELMPIFRLWQDEKQPRRSYEESAMQELVESIKSNGIIQPIMVRYHGEILLPKEKKGPQYQIVCGERRFRAAEIAGMEEIPVVIRELDDYQALEIQIIENLQRKDIHPMEEAKSFKALADHSSIEDIAIRIGKSPQTVAQRIKLNDLLPIFQDLLYANKLSLSNAAKICRFSHDTQKVIAKECVPKDWEKRKELDINGYRLSNFLDDQEQDLSKATFKTNDPLLYPEAGPCNKCPYNSSANKLLFPDMEKKRICHNAVCFQVKSKRAYQISIESALANPDLLFISCSSYPDTQEKSNIKAAEEMGAVVIKNDLFEVLEKPEPLPSWEEYLKDNDDWSDEDYGSDERKDFETQCLSDWNDEKTIYEENVKEYSAAIKSGRSKKAFVITGSYKAKEGSIVDIIIKPRKGAKVGIDSSAPDSIQQIQKETEIAAIQYRETRNRELDSEKVYLRSMDELKEMFTGLQDELHTEEWNALAVLLADSSYKARDWIQEKFGIGNDYTRKELFNCLQPDPQDLSLIRQLIRIALYDRLVNKNEADFNKNGKAAAMMSLAKLWIPQRVTIFEIEQQEKATKRTTNSQKRIAALQS
jgi:ParB family chromosome partitioning protein